MVPLLQKFVEERYPFIGADQRRALVIGATTRARQAARLHYMVTCYETSTSNTKRRSAENAKDVLCSWNFGPRQHLDLEDYQQCDILKAKVKLVLPRCKAKPRGILSSKKAKTVRDMVSKMPAFQRCLLACFA